MDTSVELKFDVATHFIHTLSYLLLIAWNCHRPKKSGMKSLCIIKLVCIWRICNTKSSKLILPLSLFFFAGVGVYISRIEEGSVAERAGLRPGDTILEVNGTPFTSISHDEALKVRKITFISSCKHSFLLIIFIIMSSLTHLSAFCFIFAFTIYDILHRKKSIVMFWIKLNWRFFIVFNSKRPDNLRIVRNALWMPNYICIFLMSWGTISNCQLYILSRFRIFFKIRS